MKDGIVDVPEEWRGAEARVAGYQVNARAVPTQVPGKFQGQWRVINPVRPTDAWIADLPFGEFGSYEFTLKTALKEACEIVEKHGNGHLHADIARLGTPDADS